MSGPSLHAAAGLAGAALVHAGLWALALRQHPEPAARTTVTVVELAPAPVVPPAPSPPAPPAPEAAPERPAPRTPARRAPSPVVSRPEPSEPLAPPPVRTVEEAVKTADSPVRFVTDPNGSAFALGHVARGGVGSGTQGAQSSLATSRTGGSGAVGAAEPALSRAPALSEPEPCRGFFPTRAQVDRGEVKLEVRVASDGAVGTLSVIFEEPAAQGFGAAARACLTSKRFSPALDPAGHPVAALSRVTLRFAR